MLWEYLDNPIMHVRQVIAAHFLREHRHILEIGGYRNPVTEHLLHTPVEVTVIDPLMEPMVKEELHGRPCAVRHVAEDLSAFDFEPWLAKDFALVFCGMDLYLGQESALEHLQSICRYLFLLSRSSTGIVEYPLNWERSARLFNVVLSVLQPRLAADIRIDLTRYPEEGAANDETRGRLLRRLVVLKDMEHVESPVSLYQPVARILFGSEAAKIVLSKSERTFREVPGALTLEEARHVNADARVEHNPDGLSLETAPEAWSYATILLFNEASIDLASASRPATVEVEMFVDAGEVGVGVVHSDLLHIVGERQLREKPGALQRVEIFVPSMQGAVGLLCRNGSLNNTVSRGRIVSVRFSIADPPGGASAAWENETV